MNPVRIYQEKLLREFYGAMTDNYLASGNINFRSEWYRRMEEQCFKSGITRKQVEMLQDHVMNERYMSNGHRYHVSPKLEQFCSNGNSHGAIGKGYLLIMEQIGKGITFIAKASPPNISF